MSTQSNPDGESYFGFGFWVGVIFTGIAVLITPSCDRVRNYELAYAESVCRDNGGIFRVVPGGAFLYDIKITCGDGAVYEVSPDELRRREFAKNRR